jgi:Hsp70 protein
MEGKTSRVIENLESARTTLSIVAFTKHGEQLVGLPAKWQAIVNPTNTVFAFKHLISWQFKDKEVQEDMAHWCVIVSHSYAATDSWHQGHLKLYPSPMVGQQCKSTMGQNTAVREYTHSLCIDACSHWQSAEELSPVVLVKMRETAEQYLNKSSMCRNLISHVPPTDCLPATQSSPSLPTSTMLSARKQRMLAKLPALTSYISSTNRPLLPWHIVSTGRILPSSQSTIWAEAPSISRS